MGGAEVDSDKPELPKGAKGGSVARIILNATRELGHQSEIELQTKLQNEVEAERVTRLDKMLLSEQQEQGVIDLRPGEGATFLVRENRNLMISRVRHLERY